MENITYKIFEKKIVIRLRSRLCENADELLSSSLFQEIVLRSIAALKKRKSILLRMFESDQINSKEIETLIQTLNYLQKLPLIEVTKIIPEAQCFVNHPLALYDYTEYLYNFWRHFDRFVICDSEGDFLHHRPYRTFNATIEQLTHLIRKIYRDIQEKIAEPPRVYRQLAAGAKIGGIALPRQIPYPDAYKKVLADIPVIRQILLNPPLVLDPPMNKRKGKFERIFKNPLDVVALNKDEWLCYPLKAGELNIMVYVHERFYELGFSLANLFQICSREDLKVKPDGVFLFGVPGDIIDTLGEYSTVFYDDQANDMMVAAVPNRDEFGYFGYLKKMILTLHNIQMMKKGSFPFHGSLTRLVIEGKKDISILVIGDTGAGKSETLEALKHLGEDILSDLMIIADDMGSLKINDQGQVIGYGTEIGAFLRLDDLSPDSTFGSIDRAIFMNTSQINSRVVIPVNFLHNVMQGTKIDFLFYANNYQAVDKDHPVLEKLLNKEDALKIFSEGTAMSKGTTASTGLQHTYFVNVFGPPEYKDLHDALAETYFSALYQNNTFVGQIRTQLGLKGKEQNGPEMAAKALIELIRQTPKNTACK